MARAVGNHSGTFDGSSIQDVIDTDPLQGAYAFLTGSADVLPVPNGASYLINGVRGGNVLISSAGVDAIVLGAPVAGVDDGLGIQFQDVGGHAHTVTSTGNLVTNSASVNTATFSGNKGATLALRAISGKWYVVAALGITFS